MGKFKRSRINPDKKNRATEIFAPTSSGEEGSEEINIIKDITGRPKVIENTIQNFL